MQQLFINSPVICKQQKYNLPFSRPSALSSVTPFERNRVEPPLPRRGRFNDKLLYGSILSTIFGKFAELIVP